MSEVLRNYTWGGNLRKRRRDLRRRGTGIAKFMLPLLFVLLIAGIWLTRDNYEREGFIPADAPIEIYIHDVIGKRSKIVESNLHSLVPESSDTRRLLEQLSGDLPVPAWLINNLSADLCHLYSPGYDRMDEVIITTQMSRIGCLTERIMRFSSRIEHDFAGGLHLRRVQDAEMYYAVRGRVLLISPSRERLVHALTLSPGDSMSEERFQDGFQNSKGTDVFVCMQSEAWPFAVKPFEKLNVAIKLEPGTSLLSVNGTFANEFMTHYAPFLADLTPQQLPTPFNSMASTSINLGTPLHTVIKEMSESFPGLDSVNKMLFPDASEADVPLPIADAPSLFREAFHLTGARTRIGWFGVDPYEMLPAPLLAATFEVNTDAVLALFERITPSTDVQSEVDLTLRLDKDILMAYSPIIGGENFEPAIGSYGRGLLFSSSAKLGRELIESTQLSESYPQPGNLYVQLKPSPIATACLDAARELAFSGMLRGHTESSIEAMASPLIATTSTMDSVVLLAACDHGQLQMNMKLVMDQALAGSAEPESENGASNE
jgi:hypothetical protein